MFTTNADKMKGNVLVVDDVTANLLALTEMLNSAGYTARPVTNVNQAQKAIDTMLPHLILLDISMPDIDGFEWCAKLKKEVTTREIPIIFISALNSDEDKQKAYELGAVDFICKPFNAKDLILRVNTHIKAAAKIQELQEYNQKLQKLMNEQIYEIERQRSVFFDLLCRIADEKNGIRKGHGKRIAANARKVALALQFMEIEEVPVNNNFIEQIVKAAPLYQIGSCLCEMSDAASKSKNKKDEPLLSMAKVIAHSYKEKWDGSGNPDHLVKDQIPLAARIVSAVIAYDTWIGEETAKLPSNMSENEKSDMSHNIVMDRLNRESGKSFDPVIITIMDKIQHQLKR